MPYDLSAFDVKDDETQYDMSAFDFKREAPKAPAGQGSAGSSKYAKDIDAAARKYGINPGILDRLIAAESSYNPNAVSPTGPIGIAQFTKKTAEDMGLTDRWNPVESINAAAKYLAHLYDHKNVVALAGDDPDKRTELAIASYNAGPGAVGKYGGIPPRSPENQNDTDAYVRKIMGDQRSQMKQRAYDMAAFDIGTSHPEGEIPAVQPQQQENRPTGLAGGPLGFNPPTEGHLPVPQAERPVEFPSGPQSIPFEQTPMAATPGASPGIDVPAGPMNIPRSLQGGAAQPNINPPDLQAVAGGGEVDWTGISDALAPSTSIGGREVADQLTESSDPAAFLTGYFYKAADVVADAAKFLTIDMAAFVTEIADATKEAVVYNDQEPLEKLGHDLLYDIEKAFIVQENPIFRMLKKVHPNALPVKIIEWLDDHAIRFNIDNLDKAREEMEQERKTHAFWQYIGRPLVASSLVKGVGKKAGKVDTSLKKPKEYTASNSQMQLLRDAAQDLGLDGNLVTEYAGKVGVGEAFRRITNPDYSDIWRKAAQDIRGKMKPAAEPKQPGGEIDWTGRVEKEGIPTEIFDKKEVKPKDVSTEPAIKPAEAPPKAEVSKPKEAWEMTAHEGVPYKATLYHGTGRSNKLFDTSKQKAYSDGSYGSAGKGFYFATTRESAATYAKLGHRAKQSPTVIEAKVSLENPKVFEDYGDLPLTGVDQARLIEMGYDGIIIKRNGSLKDGEVVAFSDSQINITNRYSATTQPTVKKSLTVEPKTEVSTPPAKSLSERRKEKKKAQAVEPETGAAEGIFQMRTKNAITDAKRFQISRPDEQPFSERTAAGVAAAELEKPGVVKDPITIWKDPKDNQWYVLDGFSRMEGFRRVNKRQANFQEFKGTEKEAIDYAIMKNKQASPPGFAGDLKSYRAAVDQKWTKKRIKETYGGDVALLDASVNLDPAGKFIEVLSQEVLSKDAPYVKRYATWVGELRKHYGDKITGRHEKQIFDFLYSQKKFDPMGKDQFFDLIEKQVDRLDWKPTDPLIMKRGSAPTVGAAATQNTAPIIKQIEGLKQLIDDTQKFARENPKSAEAKNAAQTIEDIQTRIGHLREAVKDIQDRQGDIFATIVEATKEPQGRAATFLDKHEAAAKKRVADRMDQMGRTTFDIGEAGKQALLNLADLAIIGAAKLARGTVKFKRWAKEMKLEFGKNIEPHLELIYRESLKRVDEMATEVKGGGFDKNPVTSAKKVGKRAEQASEITGELVKEAEDLRSTIMLNIGTDPIKAAKAAMTEHHVRIREPEYLTKKMKDAVNEAVPKKDRQMLVIHAYEQRRAPKYWDQLTPKEKDVVRWFEAEVDRLEGFIATHQINPRWQTELWKKGDYNYVAHWWMNPKTGAPFRTKYGRTIPASPHDIPRKFVTMELGMAEDMLVQFPKLRTLDPLEQYKIPNLFEHKPKGATEGYLKRDGIHVWIKDVPEHHLAIKELGGKIVDRRSGMKPASTNIGEIFGETWESRMRQFYSREMYENLSKLESGIPMEITTGETGERRLPRMIEKWHDIDEAGLRDEYIMTRDHRWAQAMKIERLGFRKKGKRVTYDPVAIHKDLYPFVRAYLESPTYGKWAELAFTAKSLKLGFSFFHHVSLGMQELANGRVPFVNTRRGLKLIREGDPIMRTLHKHGLEIKGYEDVNYGELFRFQGKNLMGKIGNRALAPLKASTKFLFEVVQPGMKASFAWDEFHKQWPEAQRRGISKEQLAREVVKEADSFFSGEDYKRALLESNAWMAKYYFSATARKTWQMSLISPTWQREHIIAFKRSIQSVLPKSVSTKLGLEDMSSIMRRRYQKYVAGAASMYAVANLYNWMMTKKMDGEGKFMWQNPNMWAVRMPWNTPAYEYTDASGRKHTVPSRPAYIRPFKSIIEVPEFILGHGFKTDEDTGKYTALSVSSGIADNMFRKFSYKLMPMISASVDIMFPSYGQSLNVPRDAAKWLIEVGSPIVSTQVWEAGLGKALGKVVGVDVPTTKKWQEVMAAFFGAPPSTIRMHAYKDMYYELMARAKVEGDQTRYRQLKSEYKELFKQDVSTAKVKTFRNRLTKAAGQ